MYFTVYLNKSIEYRLLLGILTIFTSTNSVYFINYLVKQKEKKSKDKVDPQVVALIADIICLPLLCIYYPVKLSQIGIIVWYISFGITFIGIMISIYAIAYWTIKMINKIRK